MPYVMQTELEERMAERNSAVEKPAKVKDEDWAQRISKAREAREQGKELRRGKDAAFQTGSGMQRRRLG
jgi:hypothetical protein